MLLYRKFQTGDVITGRQSVTYKPVLTEQEVNKINKLPEGKERAKYFPSNTKQCAEDACVDMANPIQALGMKNAYELMSAYESNIPAQVLKEGPTTSWHIAGVLADQGGKTFYNSKINAPTELKTAAKNAPIGSFLLLGPSNDDHHPTGYSGTKGFHNSNHTVVKYGQLDNGEPLFLDGYTQQLYTLDNLLKFWNLYKPQTLITPKEYMISSSEGATISPKYKNPEPVSYNSVEKFNALKNYLTTTKGAVKMHSGDMASYMRALKKYAPILSTELNLDTPTYTKLADTAVAIALQESKGGQSLRNLSGFLDKNFGNSFGFTQSNLNNVSKETRDILAKKFNIKKNEDLYNADKAAIFTIAHLNELEQTAKRAYTKGLNKRINVKGILRSPENIAKAVLRGAANPVYVPAHTTQGNKKDLTDTEILLYGWRGLKRLATGDAQGEDAYVKNANKIYEALNPTKTNIKKNKVNSKAAMQALYKPITIPGLTPSLNLFTEKSPTTNKKPVYTEIQTKKGTASTQMKAMKAKELEHLEKVRAARKLQK